MSYIGRATMLDAETTLNTYSAWVPIGEGDPDSISVHCSGIVNNDKVQIYLSSQKNPTAAEQVQFGSDITADGLTQVTDSALWMRVKLSAVAGGGSVTVEGNWGLVPC